MPFFSSSKPKKASTKSKPPSAATEPIPQSKPLFPTRPPVQAQSQYNLSSPPPNYYSPQSQRQPGPPPLGSPPAQHPYRYPPAYGPGHGPAASQALLPLPQPPPLPTNNSWPSGNPQQNNWQSCTNLAISIANPIQTYSDGLGGWQQKTTDCLNRGAALCDVIGTKFSDVISMIDGESFSGDENELVVYYQDPTPTIRGGGDITSRGINGASRTTNRAATAAITSTNYFSKANLYANSRLPPNLPPLRLYLPTYPFLCLAAQYSHRVYQKPSGRERHTHVDADWRMGTKAMVMKSVPIDDMNTVVFAIRGTQTFMDWAVNLNSAPTSPVGFLDDPGNLCHTGFLSVAKKMIRPVASRLRNMLEENPSRASCSLLITGHSAGGAVANLLYCHMLAREVKSELNILTGCFKRIHCITFGTPPISLLPLQKPDPHSHRMKKSLFLSFINEGDPVPRADKAYVRSLIDLYTSPTPRPPVITNNPFSSLLPNQSTSNLLGMKKKKKPRPTNHSAVALHDPYAYSTSPAIWPVPPSTLSNAGRLVLLRIPYNNGRSNNPNEVLACTTSDDQLRNVIFGDPLMHQMKIYLRRVEVLATNAVTAKMGIY